MCCANGVQCGYHLGDFHFGSSGCTLLSSKLSKGLCSDLRLGF